MADNKIQHNVESRTMALIWELRFTRAFRAIVRTATPQKPENKPIACSKTAQVVHK